MTPNPGSDAARNQGCTCPVMDNGRGRGDGPFWIREGCPLHDPSEVLTGDENMLPKPRQLYTLQT